MHRVFAIYRLTHGPEGPESLLEALRSAAAPFVEPGCRSSRVLRETDESGGLLLMEEWETQADQGVAQCLPRGGPVSVIPHEGPEVGQAHRGEGILARVGGQTTRGIRGASEATRDLEEGRKRQLHPDRNIGLPDPLIAQDALGEPHAPVGLGEETKGLHACIGVEDGEGEGWGAPHVQLVVESWVPHLDLAAAEALRDRGPEILGQRGAARPGAPRSR
jgi:hypothetical protein